MRENPTKKANLVDFTDEEGYGKYLDLHECYERYIYLKGIEKVDYITYLSTFDHLFDIPKDRKNAEYRRYVESLLEYLMDFLGRVKPLLDINKELTEANKDFEAQWETNSFPGWSKEAGSALTNVGALLELSAFSSWEELASLGLDRLKSALIALGLKCGGTLEERAQRLFSTKGKSSFDPNLFPKKQAKCGKGKNVEKQKGIACLEAQVYKLTELVSSQRHDTKRRIQREQGKRNSVHRDSGVETSASEEEEECLFKNLIHDSDEKVTDNSATRFKELNIRYNCGICGDFQYKGIKAFQRHFTEWRHVYGLRRLGIENNSHSTNIPQAKATVVDSHQELEQKENKKRQPEKCDDALQSFNLTRLLNFIDLHTLKKLNCSIQDFYLIERYKDDILNCIFEDKEIIQLLLNNQIDLIRILEMLDEREINVVLFKSARLQYTVEDILDLYLLDKGHLYFMAWQPTEVLKIHYYDEDMIIFGLTHYKNKINLKEIRKELSEKACKMFNSIVDKHLKKISNDL